MYSVGGAGCILLSSYPSCSCSLAASLGWWCCMSHFAFCHVSFRGSFLLMCPVAFLLSCGLLWLLLLKARSPPVCLRLALCFCPFTHSLAYVVCYIALFTTVTIHGFAQLEKAACCVFYSPRPRSAPNVRGCRCTRTLALTQAYPTPTTCHSLVA